MDTAIEFPLKSSEPTIFHVRVNGKDIGELKPCVHGPGYFLTLDRTLWQNTPGARYTADSGLFKSTHVLSRAKAQDRIKQAVRDNPALLQ